ncbi:MAG: protein kinase [Sandaracinaceae bacterium]|nr:protein kinase [Sandaracinaceae bacterium]
MVRVVADRFELENLAGSGAMGEVWRARDRESGRAVAVKVLTLVGKLALERFHSEAALLRAASHPAIVRYVAHGVAADPGPWIAMEWIDGAGLRERLEASPLSIEDTLALGQRLAGGLAALHAAGVVHRDLKPENVLLPGGVARDAKLVDFGVARTWGVRATRPGLIVGTPGYIAPEQVRGEEVDARADVFGLGALLYECLAGRPAFEGEHPLAIFTKTLLDDPIPIASLRGDAPPELEALVRALMAKEPEARPADGAAALAALRALAGGEPTAVSVSVPRVGDDERRMVSILVGQRRGGSRRPDARRGGERARAGPARRRGGALRRARRGLDEHELRHHGPARIGGHRRPEARGALRARALGGAAGARHGRRHHASGLVRSPRPRRDPGARRRAPPARGSPRDRRGGGRGDGRPPRRALRGGASRGRARRRGGAARAAAPEAARRGSAVRGPRGRARRAPGRLRALARERARGRHRVGRPGRGEVAPRDRARARDRGRGADAADRVGARRRAAQGGALRARGRAARAGGRRGEPRAPGGAAEHPPARAGDGAGHHRLAPGRGHRGHGDGAGARRRRGLPSRGARPRARDRSPRAPRRRERSRRARGPGAPGRRPLPLGARAAQAASCSSSTTPTTRTSPPCARARRAGARRRGPDLRARARDRRARRALSVAVRAAAALTPHAQAARSRGLRGAGARGGGEGASDEEVRGIVEQGEGLPFHLEELARAREGGDPRTGRDSVLSLVESRIARMPGAVRRVLRAASVFGERFDAEGVRHLLARRDADRETADALVAAVEAELVVAEEQAGVHRFRHRLVREAAYAMLTEEDRALGHRLAADWIEEAGEARAAEIASHYASAGRAREAARWYARAAFEALR